MTTTVDVAYKVDTKDLDKAKGKVEDLNKTTTEGAKESAKEVSSLFDTMAMAAGGAFADAAGKAAPLLSSLGSIGLAVGGLIAGVGAFASAWSAVADTGMRGLSALEGIQDKANQLGMSAEDLQILAFNADQSGLSLDQAASALQRLTIALGDAKLGRGGALEDALKLLNISLKDAEGNFKSVEQIILEYGQALSRVEDASVRAALGQDGFGKTIMLLLPMITKQKEETDKNVKSLEEMGGVISNKVVAAAAELKDEVDKVITAQKAFQDQADAMAGPVTLVWERLKLKVIEYWSALREGFYAALAMDVNVKGYTGGEYKPSAEQAAYEAKRDAELRAQSISEMTKQKAELERAMTIAPQGSVAYNTLATQLETVTGKLQATTQAQNEYNAVLKQTQQAQQNEILTTDELLKRQAEIDRQREEERKRRKGAGGGADERKRALQEMVAIEQQIDASLAKQQAEANENYLERERAKWEAVLTLERQALVRRLENLKLTEEEKAALLQKYDEAAVQRTIAFNQKIEAENAEREVREAERAKRMADKNKTQFERMIEDWGDAAKQMDEVGTQFLYTLERAFDQFVETGKINFSELAASFLKELAKMELRAAASSLWNWIKGGSSGGSVIGSIFNWLASEKGNAFYQGQHVQPFASGGIVNSPTMFGYGSNRVGIAGEAGSEAILPITRQGGVMGVNAYGLGNKQVNINTTIQVSGGATSEDSEKIARETTRSIETLVRRVIADETRAGNTLNPIYQM